QVSGQVPQVLFSARQVVGVQPQTPGIPPPPQVSGAMQSLLLMQPHWPVALHICMLPQAVPAGAGGCDGTPAVQTSSVHGLPSTGRSMSSGIEVMPPLPSQTAVLQLPAVWLARGVLAAVFAGPQVWAVHAG